MANPPLPLEAPPAEAEPSAWQRVRLNLLLFALTVVSVYITKGTAFTLSLLGILLAHEFGHYFAARYHGVPASLPYFIPFPFLSPFGTAGAVIAMRGAIRSRNALLDIGASGPLAGMVVALPVLFWGLAHSEVSVPVPPYTQEGQSLLYVLSKWLVLGPISAGQDVLLHPVAEAGWAGLFVTMINLLPFGQLDGGHISYALFGERQNRAAPWIRRALLPLFLFNVLSFLAPTLFHGAKLDLLSVFGNSLFWLFWYGLLGLLARFSGGTDHPPCERGELSRVRRGVAWFSLALFLLLFMPTPYSQVLQ